jgi:hypothetical protein
MSQAHEVLMTQMLDGNGANLLQGVPTRVELDVDDAPLGTVSIEADEVEPPLGDSDGSLRCDLVVRATDSSMPGHTTPSDMVQSPCPRVPWVWA